MEQYAGIDVSLELKSVCVVDGQDKSVGPAKSRHETMNMVRTSS